MKMAQGLGCAHLVSLNAHVTFGSRETLFSLWYIEE